MKSRHWGRPSVLAAAWAVASWSAIAQPATSTPSSPATLRQAFDAAWERQPERQSEAWRRHAAAAGVDAAQRWTPEPPVLEASAKSDRWTRNDGAREYDAALSVPLWWPGERSRVRAAAAAEAGAVDARLQAGRWRVAGEVREAWWALRRMRLDHALTQQRLAGARQLAADVARRLRAGDLARSDNHQAEAAAADAESAVAEAKAALLQAEADWTALTGQVAADDDVAAEPAPADATLGDGHPALQEQAAKAELARQALALAGVQTRSNPELTIGTAHERGSFGERYGQSVVIGVRIPLGRSSASSAQRATANAELLEAAWVPPSWTDQARPRCRRPPRIGGPTLRRTFPIRRSNRSFALR